MSLPLFVGASTGLMDVTRAPVDINETGGETEVALAPPRERVPAVACCCIVATALEPDVTLATVILKSTIVEPALTLSTFTLDCETTIIVARSASIANFFDSHWAKGRFSVMTKTTLFSSAVPVVAIWTLLSDATPWPSALLADTVKQYLTAGVMPFHTRVVAVVVLV